MEVQLQTFVIENKSISLFVPNSDAVQQWYAQEKNNNPTTPFPYWAKVWPSAIGLCAFLENHLHYIQNKNVLEVAAGLGLPSVFAAKYSKTVCCTDYVQEPLNIVQQSTKYNGLQNITCEMYNWNEAPRNNPANVVLLSDINYEPSAFGNLYIMIDYFLKEQATIIIATPQRLMGKSFIEKLLPFCIKQEVLDVESTPISVLVLQKIE
jgi:methyltransferase-like protein 23